MNKLIAVLYALYAALHLAGCATKADYEIRLWMNRGDAEVNGYVRIDGQKHPLKVTYND